MTNEQLIDRLSTMPSGLRVKAHVRGLGFVAVEGVVYGSEECTILCDKIENPEKVELLKELRRDLKLLLEGFS